MLAAPFYAQLWFRKIQPPYWLLRPPITCAWLALTVIAFSFVHWLELAARRKPSEAGQYLSEHSAPNDRIFVWGQAQKFILRLGEDRRVATSKRLRSRVMFSAEYCPGSIPASGSCRARGLS